MTMTIPAVHPQLHRAGRRLAWLLLGRRMLVRFTAHHRFVGIDRAEVGMAVITTWLGLGLNPTLAYLHFSPAGPFLRDTIGHPTFIAEHLMLCSVVACVIGAPQLVGILLAWFGVARVKPLRLTFLMLSLLMFGYLATTLLLAGSSSGAGIYVVYLVLTIANWRSAFLNGHLYGQP